MKCQYCGTTLGLMAVGCRTCNQPEATFCEFSIGDGVQLVRDGAGQHAPADAYDAFYGTATDLNSPSSDNDVERNKP